jgi:hypothetical protein
MNCVRVTPFETTDDVVWTGHDGKPRCARHPYCCLVKASAIWPEVLYGVDDYVCAQCMREER